MSEILIDRNLFEALREMRSERNASGIVTPHSASFQDAAQEQVDPWVRILEKRVDWLNVNGPSLRIFDQPDLHRKFDAVLAICKMRKTDISVTISFELSSRRASSQSYVIKVEEKGSLIGYQYYNKFLAHKYLKAKEFKTSPEGRRAQFHVVGTRPSP